MRENKRSLGGLYERKAADYLVSQGMKILCMNYRCRLGEIDLIGEDQGTIVFAEVKYRCKNTCGYGFDAVDYRKQKRISKTASYYLVTHKGTLDVPCRFDVVSFDGENLTWIKDAFMSR